MFLVIERKLMRMKIFLFLFFTLVNDFDRNVTRPLTI